MKVTLEHKILVDPDTWSDNSDVPVSGRELWNEISGKFLEKFTQMRVLKDPPVLMRSPNLGFDADTGLVDVTASIMVNVKPTNWIEFYDTDGMHASDVRDQIAEVAEGMILDAFENKGVIEASVHKTK